MNNNVWKREELILAFHLYCKIPFGQIHNRNPQIIELAKLLERTPSALSWKLANFASFDPALRQRGIAGATHGSKNDRLIWEEFHDNWDELLYQSEILLARYRNISIEDSTGVGIEESFDEGIDKHSITKVRVNQQSFRQIILASYSYQCCITGLAMPQLLIASHIIPWSIDIKNRMNPRNGLCLNALHDKAFDRGLITITPDYKIKVSSSLKTQNNDVCVNLFLSYDGCKIILPDKFVPDDEFLTYHNTNIFIQ